jgi:hypothetical protein
MISGYPGYFHSRRFRVTDGREDAEAGARDNSAPLEPEVEQVAVDDDRPRSAGGVAQEVDDARFHAVGRGAEVSV